MTAMPLRPGAPPEFLSQSDGADWVSLLADGECTNPVEWGEAWAQVAASDAALGDWHAHHLIGEALRGESPLHTDGLNAKASQAFAQRVLAMAQASGSVAHEAAEAATATPPAQVHTAVVPPAVVQPVASAHQVKPWTDTEAANDRVFRWKAVAGLASFSAVLSVTWGVWSGGGAGGAVSLAQAPAPVQVSAPAPTATMADSASQPPAMTAAAPREAGAVLVATERGVVERDARLDALIQAHRQQGGATAWQVPAGFMRASVQDR